MEKASALPVPFFKQPYWLMVLSHTKQEMCLPCVGVNAQHKAQSVHLGNLVSNNGQLGLKANCKGLGLQDNVGAQDAMGR